MLLSPLIQQLILELAIHEKSTTSHHRCGELYHALFSCHHTLLLSFISFHTLPFCSPFLILCNSNLFSSYSTLLFSYFHTFLLYYLPFLSHLLYSCLISSHLHFYYRFSYSYSISSHVFPSFLILACHALSSSLLKLILYSILAFS